MAREKNKKKTKSNPDVKAVPEQIGIIDIGAHSIRLEIFQLDPEKPNETELFESLSREINLGEDVFKRGSVSSATLNQACEIMQDFADKLREYNVTKYRAVATSALREAVNRDIVLDRIKMDSNLDVEVLETQEEGKILYCATRELLQKAHVFPKKQALIFFIGTGSLIVMFINNGRLQFCESSAFGSIRILDEYGNDSIRPQRMSEILKSMEFKSRLSRVAGYDPAQPVELIGVGAGLRAGEQLCDGATVDKAGICRLNAEQLKELFKKLKNATSEHLVAQLEIVDHLALSIITSYCIADYFASEFKSGQLILPGMNTRLALLRNMISPDLQQDFRKDLLTAVENIGNKYNFDKLHAAEASYIALAIFDKLRRHFRMGEHERMLLECSAMLHDIGRFVDIRQHHKHSFYLIRNSHIPGLSGRDLHLVASIARYHRKSAPKSGQLEFDCCSPRDKVILQKLAAILRVADSMVRGDLEKHLKLSVHLIEGCLVFRNPGNMDMLWESVYLAKKGDMFKEVFGLKLKFEEELKRS